MIRLALSSPTYLAAMAPWRPYVYVRQARRDVLARISFTLQRASIEYRGCQLSIGGVNWVSGCQLSIGVSIEYRGVSWWAPGVSSTTFGVFGFQMIIVDNFKWHPWGVMWHLNWRFLKPFTFKPHNYTTKVSQVVSAFSGSIQMGEMTLQEVSLDTLMSVMIVSILKGVKLHPK